MYEKKIGLSAKKIRSTDPVVVGSPKKGTAYVKGRLRKDWLLYLMLIPGALYFLIFKYGPMLGLITAFQDYNAMKGWFGSEFVGLKHFERFFTDPKFFQIFRNTLILAVLNVVFYFPLPSPVYLRRKQNEPRNFLWLPGISMKAMSCIFF